MPETLPGPSRRGAPRGAARARRARAWCTALALWLPGAWVAAAEAGEPAASAAGWDLADLYPSTEAWTAERDRVAAQAEQLARRAGTLGRGASDMLAALDAISQVQRQAARLATYASLKADENVKIAVNQERRQAAQALQARIAAQTAWVAPEIIALGAARVAQFEDESAPLRQRFGFYLDNTLRAREHTLGAQAEGVMASAGEVLAQPNNVFAQLVDGELPWSTVRLADGAQVKVDQPNFEKIRQAADRDDRRKAFAAFFGALAGFRGTLGANLNTQVLAEEFDAKVRGFPDALSDALFADNMPQRVYRTLVEQTQRNLPTLHRYLKLRRAALGLPDGLDYADLYAPIFELAHPPRYTPEEMRRVTRAATAPYGARYAQLLESGFAGRWMDLYPREGKAGGAYMNGSAYDVHPYLLFNNRDDYASLTTFAHEWGHAVHTLLATQRQPFETSNYSTFIAETASIANEMLLADYLADNAGSDAERRYYLGQQLELIRKNFFRQAMFAEFQLAIHEEVEKGATLSGERISDLYCAVVRRYYGAAQGVTRIDPADCIEWAFIPHLYYGFYVYQYATSTAGAARLTEAIRNEGAPARERFLAMLEAGGSDYPYELYRKAGLDMASAAPYEALFARMNRVMDRIEALGPK
jgi:oligoendopeptidase F